MGSATYITCSCTKQHAWQRYHRLPATEGGILCLGNCSGPKRPLKPQTQWDNHVPKAASLQDGRHAGETARVDVQPRHAAFPVGLSCKVERDRADTVCTARDYADNGSMAYLRSTMVPGAARLDVLAPARTQQADGSGCVRMHAPAVPAQVKPRAGRDQERLFRR